MLYERGGYYPKVQYTVEDFEDLHSTEKAIRKLDRIKNKITRFNMRAILDPENHERREKRMHEKELARNDGQHVNYVGTNEDE
jgi:phage shock protein A